MPESSRAVFLSYASQDSDAARMLCDALRAAGVEVWFDQSELRGGDAWDAKIRRQIKECALFLPIISANTQARTEGYFRLEWRLADQRTHLMAKGRAFLLPIAIDDTRDAEAHVPDSFLEVQWSRITTDAAAVTLAARVRALLERSAGNLPANEPSIAGERRQVAGATAGASRTSSRGRRLVVAAAAIIIVAAIVFWPRGRRAANPAPVTNAPANRETGSTELAAVRARIVPDRWQKEDFETVSSMLDRIVAASPDLSDAWALRSIINTLQVTRNYDSGTTHLAAGQSAADRALRLAPASPLAELAMGFHLMAMVTRGGDPQTGRPYLDRALAALPRDAITRYIELVSAWQCYDLPRTEQSSRAWLAAEPEASLPAWIIAQMNVVLRRPDEVETWAERAATDRNVTGIRAYYTIFESKYYLRADLAGARAALDRVPASGRLVHRVVHGHWLLAMAERRWDDALQGLSRVTDSFLFDRTYHGPRALLAGLAHQRAGRADAAAIQFREAERLLRERLAADAENDELHAELAVTLACEGRAADARSELGLVEPLLTGRVPSIYRGPQTVPVAQARAILGDTERMNFWLRKLFAEPAGIPFTPASLRMDPRFTGLLEAPETQALLREFAHLDQPAKVSAVASEGKSIAVLAFENLSADRENEYFSDGISDELLNQLGQVPGLRVAGRMSAFSFKGKNVPDAEIARTLGVAYLVNGSVQRSAATVRITARLNRAADGVQLWSESFTKELRDVFAVQDEIAGRIAQNLQLKLGYPPRLAKVVNPEAHRLVLEGRHFWLLRNDDGFARAEAAFRGALRLDPDFAEAHAGLADVAVIRGWYSALGDGPALADLKLARDEATEALRLDATLAGPHAALGVVYLNEWKLADAEQAFQTALRLNPNYAYAHHWRAHLVALQGRMDEALAELERAAQLDPLSFITLAVYAMHLEYAGRYAEMVAMADRAQALRSDLFVPLGATRALALWNLGRRDEAVAAARVVTADPRRGPRWWTDYYVMHVLRQAGLESEARAHAARLEKEAPPGVVPPVVLLAGVGRTKDVLNLMAERRLGASVVLTGLFFSSAWNDLRGEAGFPAAVAKAGLTEEYRRAQDTQARLRTAASAKP